jgi:uncharacterized NAD(P)/FAD-binding protein YdhS
MHSCRSNNAAIAARSSPHRKSNPIKLDVADIPLGTQLSYFVGWFRDLIRENQKAGIDWRDVVDGLPPFNQKIWQNWPSSAKCGFVEHNKAWWDIHRHRMAPQVYARVTEAVQPGHIRVVAGRVVGIAASDEFTVQVQSRIRSVSKRSISPAFTIAPASPGTSRPRQTAWCARWSTAGWPGRIRCALASTY